MTNVLCYMYVKLIFRHLAPAPPKLSGACTAPTGRRRTKNTQRDNCAGHRHVAATCYARMCYASTTWGRVVWDVTCGNMRTIVCGQHTSLGWKMPDKSLLGQTCTRARLHMIDCTHACPSARPQAQMYASTRTRKHCNSCAPRKDAIVACTIMAVRSNAGAYSIGRKIDAIAWLLD